MDSFAEFSKRFKLYVAMCNSDYSDAVIEDIGRPREPFIKNIRQCLDESRLFLINEKIKKLLCLTKTPNKNNKDLRLPFDTIFLDVRFTKEEAEKYGFKFGEVREVVGIILNQLYLKESDMDGYKWESTTMNELLKFQSDDETDVAVGIRASVLCVEDHDKDYKGAITFSTFNFPYVEVDNVQRKISVAEIRLSKPVKRFIQMFSYNFLNFMYEREVEYIFKEYDESKIRKRKARGKDTPLGLATIKITGTLKKYIDSLPKESFEYSHSFWVRGTYRFLQSERYVNKRFQRIWVTPFLKGKNKGLPIEKVRELEDGGVKE